MLPLPAIAIYVCSREYLVAAPFGISRRRANTSNDNTAGCTKP